MRVSLKEWLRSGWLTEHKTSKQELRDLFGVIDRDLEACCTAGLIADWRFNIAYNAALQLAKAALAASGYEASRVGHHYRMIQSLHLTIGAKQDIVLEFDRARKKRNLADYERAGIVSDLEADAMFEFAKQLYIEVRDWLKENHPSLMKK